MPAVKNGDSENNLQAVYKIIIGAMHWTIYELKSEIFV
jgi:hypothetical protein